MPSEPPVKLAIADPPYLGRAQRWYGVDGCGAGAGKHRADEHPAARAWDDPEAHRQLVRDLVAEFDAWAVAMSPHSLDVYLAEVELGSRTGYRVGAWVKPRAAPSGSRIATSWEPVLFYLPPSRRPHGSGPAVRDFVECSPGMSGFIGSKPAAWTRWVLDVLGYDPDVDTVSDLFAGSGAVAAAAAQGVLL